MVAKQFNCPFLEVCPHIKCFSPGVCEKKFYLSFRNALSLSLIHEGALRNETLKIISNPVFGLCIFIFVSSK